MTHDEKIVEAVATAEVRYDGYEDLLCLSRTMRERYLDRARAAITAYQAEAWQPIENAPKDGEIIIITNGRWVEVTHWSVTDDQYPWVMLDPAIGINGRMEDSPTHFQPLPPAPKATP